MTSTPEWPELSSTITATRTARDRAAAAAVTARNIGIPTMGAQLDSLAAAYDRLLANLLYLEATFPDGPRAPQE